MNLDIFLFGRWASHIRGGLRETQSDIQSGMTFYLVYMNISLLLHYGTVIFDNGMILLLVKRKVK